ncbi:MULTISPECIES: glycosyltransferase [Paenibacillus]|uniref:glycosyltransferase n=1 Tax=Paenibacillus TaxID=44249 RepID=UPI00067617F5|nr:MULTISPECIES: glycosyltransferase [Paenibacillus]
MNAKENKPVSSVTWIGPQFEQASLAHVNREIGSRLAERRELVSFSYMDKVNQSEIVPEYKKIQERTWQGDESSIAIAHQWPPDFKRPNSEKWIVMQPWEFGAIPRDWYIPFKYHTDEIWVYTSHTKDCYVKCGIPAEKIKVIPLGVDPSLYCPSGSRYPLPTKKKFVFLFVGGTIYRKGIDTLLQAYIQEFSPEDDVVLVIKDNGQKTSYQGQTNEEAIQKIQTNDLYPEIVYITDDLTPSQMAELYRSADCLVHPYRGEGFGLPIAEAMACGIPPIVPDRGASMDFCDEETAILVPSFEKRELQMKLGVSASIDFPWVIEIHVEDLRQKMRSAYQDPERLRELGANASSFIRQAFTWDATADTVEAEIERVIEEGQGRTRAKSDIIEEESSVAFEFYKQGNDPKAETIFRAILDHYPHRLDIRYNLAVVLFRMGSIQSARQQLQWITGIMKNETAELQSDIWNLLGVCYSEAASFSKAAEAFRNALVCNENHPTAAESLAYAETMLLESSHRGSVDETNPGGPDQEDFALALINNEIQLDEIQLLSDEDLQYILDSAFLATYHKAVSVRNYLTGIIMLKLDRIEESIQNLRLAVKHFQEGEQPAFLRFASLKHLGRAYFTKKDLHQAVHYFREALSMTETTGRAADKVLIREWIEEAEREMESLRNYYCNHGDDMPESRPVSAADENEGQPEAFQNECLKTYFNEGDHVLVLDPPLLSASESFSNRGKKTRTVGGIAVTRLSLNEFRNEQGLKVDGIYLGKVAERILPHEWIELLSLCAGSLSSSGKMIILSYDVEAQKSANMFWERIEHVRPYPKTLMQSILASAGMTVTLGFDAKSEQAYGLVACKRPYEVLWQSPVYDASGYANEQVDYLDCLRSLPLKIQLQPKEQNPRPDLLKEEKLTYLNALQKNRNSNGIVHYQAGPGFHFLPPLAPVSIGRTMFETDRIPEGWLPHLNGLTEIWVPSAFNRDTFAASGVDPTKLAVIPEVLDERRYEEASIRPFPLKEVKNYVFVSNFDWSKRKGWDVLIRAYVQEFGAYENVSLVLKVNLSLKPDSNPSMEIMSLVREMGLNAFPHIQVIDSYLGEEELLGLYRACDAYVMPSRGEGWGRPYWDAMALGLPTIGTRWSGQLEFMTDENSYLIDVEDFHPVSEDMPSFYHGHRWAEPSVVHLRALMRHVFLNRVEAAEKGSFARADLHKRFSKQRVGQMMFDRIEKRVHEFLNRE